ncbi:LEA type 2 family protein [Uliginosibacterium sp. H3]|uniref:LEA type 2 family protein n=1 Tax=Uliginosibacterium silvisoli TaxID=3114758 RepID=A0ABU6K6S4_9RHOO|nr:LEA type 2 family protein [Uliginosibacterium sp. H3]
MKARSWVSGWGVALLVLALSACASLQWHKPKVTLADVKVSGGNLLEKRLLLTLRVHNENDRDIVLDGLVFSVIAGDFVLVQGARNQPVVVARMADTLVDVEATARALDMLARLPGLVQKDGSLEYVVKGEALIRDYGKVPFDHRDRLDVQKLLGGASPRPPAASPAAPQ